MAYISYEILDDRKQVKALTQNNTNTSKINFNQVVQFQTIKNIEIKETSITNANNPQGK